MKRPDWWPECPYPEDIFPMARERYVEIVSDPEVRTALSGMLGRLFWQIADDMIWQAYQQHVYPDLYSVWVNRAAKIVAVILTEEGGPRRPWQVVRSGLLWDGANHVADEWRQQCGYTICAGYLKDELYRMADAATKGRSCD